MKVIHILAALLMAFGLSLTAHAQQPDEIDQLAEMIGLSDEQQSDIRGILNEKQGQIAELQQQAQQLQQQLQAHVKPGFDEAAIRRDAKQLGELTGEMTALSMLMQAQVESIFTEEQRDELERRMQEMQRQMQQQQMQMQMR